MRKVKGVSWLNNSLSNSYTIRSNRSTALYVLARALLLLASSTVRLTSGDLQCVFLSVDVDASIADIEKKRRIFRIIASRLCDHIWPRSAWHTVRLVHSSPSTIN